MKARMYEIGSLLTIISVYVAYKVIAFGGALCVDAASVYGRRKFCRKYFDQTPPIMSLTESYRRFVREQQLVAEIEWSIMVDAERRANGEQPCSIMTLAEEDKQKALQMRNERRNFETNLIKYGFDATFIFMRSHRIS